MRANRALTVALCLAAALASHARPDRSPAARTEFVKANPCPSTGRTRGACPGHVVDHIEPLCAGGADAPHNMQWQTVEDAKAKDRQELKQCRELRRK